MLTSNGQALYAWKKLAASKFLVGYKPAFSWGWPATHMQETVNELNAKLEVRRQSKEANRNYLDCFQFVLGWHGQFHVPFFHVLMVQGANNIQESCLEWTVPWNEENYMSRKLVLCLLLWVKVNGMISIYGLKRPRWGMESPFKSFLISYGKLLARTLLYWMEM